MKQLAQTSRIGRMIGNIRKIAQRRRAARRAKATWQQPAQPWQPQLKPAFTR